jgi:alkylglycerol monooxygenase
MTLLHDVTPKTFHKYDTTLPGNLNYYVFIHFVLILIGTSVFLFNYKSFNMPMQIFVSAVVVFSLVNVGGIFESKRWVLPLEYFRLFLISLTLFITLRQSEYFWIVFVIQSVLFLGSILWLSRYFDYFNRKAEFNFNAS